MSAFYELWYNMGVKLRFSIQSSWEISWEHRGSKWRTRQAVPSGPQDYGGVLPRERDKHMIAHYYWSVKRDCSEAIHKRKSFKHCFRPDLNITELCVFLATSFFPNNEFRMNSILCIYLFQIKLHFFTS